EHRLRASYGYTSLPASPTVQASLRAVFRRLSLPAISPLSETVGLARLAGLERGLVVLAGPSGSGRTTTMAAIPDHINRTRACHIMTIEATTEFAHEPVRAHVTEREVPLHSPSFEDAVRDAALLGPDVLLVSESSSTAVVRAMLDLAATSLV